MQNNEESPSDEEKDNDCVPPQEILDYDVITCEGQEDVECIPTNCRNPYNEISLSEKTREMLLFIINNYTVSASVVCFAHKTHIVNYVFDTGVRPKLIQQKLSQGRTVNYIQVYSGPAMNNEARQKV